MGEVIGLGSADSTSTNFVKKLLNNGFDKLPVMSLSIVDVEEVALAHLRALTVPKAANQRYIISNRHCSWVEMATILNEELAKEYDGVNVTTKQWSYCQAWTQSFYS
jgi:nucleoside-diphosphate-sugar epimerase